MPYKVVKKGNKWEVRKKTGKLIGTHKTRTGALAQMRALYAREGGYPRKGKKK